MPENPGGVFKIFETGKGLREAFGASTKRSRVPLRENYHVPSARPEISAAKSAFAAFASSRDHPIPWFEAGPWNYGASYTSTSATPRVPFAPLTCTV
jgi:hypothetical protein